MAVEGINPAMCWRAAAGAPAKGCCQLSLKNMVNDLLGNIFVEPFQTWNR